MAQEGFRGSGFTQGDLLPDQCAADIFVPNLHRWQDVDRPPSNEPLLAKEETISRSPPAETEIFPHDQSRNSIAPIDPVQEFRRFHVGKPSRERDSFKSGDPVEPSEGFSFRFGEEVAEGGAAENRLRMRVKGNDAPFFPVRKGPFPSGFEKPDVTQVKAVERTERGDHA